MKINENLVLDSGKEIRSSDYYIGQYELSEKWEVGQTYTLSFDVVDFKGEELRSHMFVDSTLATSTKDAKVGNRYSGTFTCEEISSRATESTLTKVGFYNYPKGYSGQSAVIKNVKLEKGKEATLYIPNKADLKDSSLYPNKVGGGIEWEEIRPI